MSATCTPTLRDPSIPSGWVRSPMMNQVCRIRADVFERRSGVVQSLTELGVAVVVERLEVADYEVGDGALVERKTIADLHLSLERGRLWRQIGVLRRAAVYPCLLIEGADLDCGPIASNAIRAVCLAVLAQGVAILRTSDRADSARWLALLAARQSSGRLRRDRPHYAQRPKPADEAVGEAMLAMVPGISTRGARDLLAHFGSVSGVVAAGYSEWITVSGIGHTRAQALARALS